MSVHNVMTAWANTVSCTWKKNEDKNSIRPTIHVHGLTALNDHKRNSFFDVSWNKNFKEDPETYINT